MVSYRIANPSYRNEADDFGKWYVTENFVVGQPEVSSDNWNGGVQTKTDVKNIKLDKAWKSMPIKQQSAEEAYQSVLEKAGATLPKRDAVDLRIIDEVKNGYASFEGPTYETQHKVADSSKKSGIIDSQEDVSGWPVLNSVPAPKDSDHDGMPDNWEVENGLDKENPEDRNIVGKNGYTMLEKYIYELTSNQI